MADDYISRQDAIDTISMDGINCHEELVDIWAIERIPAADVVPVVHGKWIKVGVWGRVYRCNRCGNFLDFDGVNAGRGDANFCPNCCAKMEEDNG